jgi:hypothetical protein
VRGIFAPVGRFSALRPKIGHQVIEDLKIVVFDHGTKLIVHLQRLPEVEQMLRTPVAGQLFGDLRFGFAAATIAQLSQRFWIAFSGQNGPDDGHVGDAGDF